MPFRLGLVFRKRSLLEEFRLPDLPPASLGKRATDDPAKGILRGYPSRVATGGYVSQNRTSFARHWRYALRRRYRPRPHRHSGVLRDQASGQNDLGHQRQGAWPHRRSGFRLDGSSGDISCRELCAGPGKSQLRSMCGGDSAPVHPEALPHYRHQTYFAPDLLIDWTTAEELSTAQQVWLPASAVFFFSSPRLYDVTSNGLASGNELTEATLHALYELIERDGHIASLRRWPNSSRSAMLQVRRSRHPGRGTREGVDLDPDQG